MDAHPGRCPVRLALLARHPSLTGRCRAFPGACRRLAAPPGRNLGRPSALVRECRAGPLGSEGSTSDPIPLEWNVILARSSAVEHHLDTVGVGGSRPPAPTTQWPLLRPFFCPKRTISVRRKGPVDNADSGLRPSPLRGRHRLWRCGPILPPLRYGRMVETARANHLKAAFAAFFMPR